jgi:hypothetical protein
LSAYLRRERIQSRFLRNDNIGELEMANVIGFEGGRSGRPEPIPCGVWGDSQDGFGVEGTSGKSTGVVGISLLAGQVIGEFEIKEGGVGVYGENTELFGIGVRGQANKGTAVSGLSTEGDGVVGQGGKTGISGTGGNIGVSGTGDIGVAGSGRRTGVQGYTASGTGVLGISNTEYGVKGYGGNIGVYAENKTDPSHVAYLATRGLAADFYGDVYIHGRLTKTGGGSFRIDHPLDPANKYLSHSFVESPDMKNLYDGVAVLDENGEVVVELPDWFDALNVSCCYQLTSIGVAGPNLYIAEEITNNHFKIAGGTPGMKVSWQLTGIRRDAWANANRIEVEEEKPVEERGHYLHPHLYGQAEEKGLRMARYPESIKREE